MKIYLLTAAALIFHRPGVAVVARARAFESTNLHLQVNLGVAGAASAAVTNATSVAAAADAAADDAADDTTTTDAGAGSEDAEPTTTSTVQALSPKLQIGTQPGGANVVADFEVVPSWQNGDDLESEVPAQSAATDFFLKVSGAGLQLTRASVTPESLPHVQNYLDGALAQHLRLQGQATLKPEETRRLTVVYECHYQGDVALVLTLEFEGLSPVQVPWKKKCGGVQNTALTVTTGSTDQSFFDKVVIMGVPQWDELKVVGEHVSVTKFHVFVDPLSERPAQEISKPQAQSSGACSVKVASSIEGKATLEPGESTSFSVTYVCRHHGQCAVQVAVPFEPFMAPYRPTRWKFTKLCGTAAPGIEVEGDFQGKKKQLLVAGSAHTSHNPEWLIGPKVHSHQLRLLNDKALSQESEIKVQSVQVRCLDTLRCTARIASAIPQYLSATEPADVQVEYFCRTSGSSLVQLLLFTESREPVTVMWAKDCSAWTDSLWFILLASFFTCGCVACGCIGCLKMLVDKEELQTDFNDEQEMEDPDQMQERWAEIPSR
mmetsp:Transcript_106458/g.193670  ORF Transcript_106458/g.193670 Transcript_106458/m.193670 type:complete len:547 (+) Transcript_106458:116-1756(+)